MDIVCSIDRQIGHWMGEAKRLYGIETFPKKLYHKMLMGARSFMRKGECGAARAFVYRQLSKRWQYLNDERIVEFIEDEYGVRCERFTPQTGD